MITLTNKLVRDNIPDIIAKKGGRADVRILNDKEYRNELITKMREETSEYEKDNNKEELADMYEVLKALVEAHGTDMKEIEEIATQKREKNGAFEKRIFMECYHDSSCLR